MKVWWCETHEMAQMSETDACDKGYEFAETDRCSMVPMLLVPPEGSFNVQLSTDEDVESLDFQYWHQDLTDFVWARGGWAWFALVPIDAPFVSDDKARSVPVLGLRTIPLFCARRFPMKSI